MASSALVQARAQLDKMRKGRTALSKRHQAASSKALITHSLSTIAGGALCGAIAGGLGQEEVMGAPIEVAIGGGLVIAGVASGQAALTSAGAGALACYARDFVEDMLDPA